MARYTDIPEKSFVQLLPSWMIPYAQLARWDRPIGTWLLFWPCVWGVLLAGIASGQDQGQGQGLTLASFGTSLWYIALFGAGAFLMRGAGCTINDMADQKFDAQVERTATRPLPSGRVTTKQAAAFMALQCLSALIIVLQFNWFTVILSFGSLVIVAAYPFAKRITYWPQAVLGLAFNWGALVGWSAVTGSLSWPAILLYVAGISWTLGYDTIYAHQDKADDAIVGVKSTALKFGDQSRLWIAGFYALAGNLILLAGFMAGAGWIFLALMILPGLHFAWQVMSVNFDNQQDCLDKFKSNTPLGGLIACALCVALLLS